MYEVIQKSTSHVLGIHSFYYPYIPLFILQVCIQHLQYAKYSSKSFPSTIQAFSEEQNIWTF